MRLNTMEKKLSEEKVSVVLGRLWKKIEDTFFPETLHSRLQRQHLEELRTTKRNMEYDVLRKRIRGKDGPIGPTGAPGQTAREALMEQQIREYEQRRRAFYEDPF